MATLHSRLTVADEEFCGRHSQWLGGVIHTLEFAPVDEQQDKHTHPHRRASNRYRALESERCKDGQSSQAQHEKHPPALPPANKVSCDEGHEADEDLNARAKPVCAVWRGTERNCEWSQKTRDTKDPEENLDKEQAWISATSLHSPRIQE